MKKMSFGGWDAIFDKRIFAIHKDKEIFVIKQINIIEEQQLLVKFFCMNANINYS